MSRIGKKPSEIPAGVNVTLDGKCRNSKRSERELSRINKDLTISVEDNTI